VSNEAHGPEKGVLPGTRDTVRIGVIGCGNVLQEMYYPRARALSPGLVELVAACDLEESRRELVRGRLGLTRFSTDYRELVDADDIDLLLVLTPMQTHGEIALAAIEAGKHVLVEKPMATTLEQGRRLVEASRTSRGYLVPAPHVVLSPTFQDMRKRIQGGDIGRVHLARALQGWSGPDWGQWFYRKGGGSLFDLGVYSITTLTGLIGPARRVTAFVGIANPERVAEGETITAEADDNEQVLIDFGDQTYAVVTTGYTIQEHRRPWIELYGSNGTIQTLGFLEGFELWQSDLGDWQIYRDRRHLEWHFTDGLTHLVNCIRDGVRPLVTPEHAFHVLEIMLQAMECGTDGQAREIESTFTPPSFSGPEPG